MKNLLFRCLLLPVLGISFLGCSDQFQVYTDADPDMDVLVYKTYSWPSRTEVESRNNPLLYNELTDKRIRKAVDNQLGINRYILSDSTADLKVHYHIIVKDKSIVRLDNPQDDSYTPYWSEGGRNAYQYKEGTLIIDLMDAETCNLIWRGWVVGVIDEDNALLTQEEITEAVETIFKNYPKHPVQ